MRRRVRGILRGRTLVLLTIALLIAIVAQRTCGNADGSYPIVSVVDGDTIKVRMSGRVESVRLIGIDAPETNAPGRPVQCFGPEASVKAKQMFQAAEAEARAAERGLWHASTCAGKL